MEKCTIRYQFDAILKFAILSIAILALLCTQVFSQTPSDTVLEKSQRLVKITGSVENSDGQPYSFLTVVLIKDKDSSVVKGTISNIKGSFIIQVPLEINTSYSLIASSLSDKLVLQKVKGINDFRDTTLALGKLVVSTQLKTLEEIRVSGKRPLLVRKLDRLEFDVSNSVLSTGYSTLEVLSKLPGITVDVSGNVLLNGRGDIYLLIDGKGQFLQKEQAQTVLNGLRSENIERIEIISNPPARYDAQGAAVINITTKKNKMVSDIHATYGNQIFPISKVSGFQYNFFTGGINLNRSFGKLKFFLSSDLILNHEYRNSTTSSLILVSNGIIRENNSLDIYRETGLNYRVGLNLDITKKSDVDIVFNSFGSPYKRYNTSVDNNYFNVFSHAFDSSYNTRGYRLGNKGRFSSISGKYHISFNEQQGKNLYFFADYSKSTNPSKESSLGYYYLASTAISYKQDDFLFDRTYKVEIISTSVNYEQQINKNGALDFGAKITKIQNSTNDSFRYLVSDPQGLGAESKINQFKYEEIVSGFYLLGRQSWKTLKIQFGFRGENTVSTGKTFASDKIVRARYFNLFPSIAFQYGLSNNDQVGLTYAKRIVRPGYNDFNPNGLFNGVLSITSGTLNIKPQFQNNVELSYLRKSYFFSINASHAGNPRIDLPSVIQDSGITINRYVTSLKNTFNLSFNISAPIRITKFWQTYNNISIVNNSAKLLTDQKESKWYGSLNSSHTLNLKIRSKFELNFYYTSGSLFAYTETKHIINLSVGYRYVIRKGKLEASININDILGTNKFRMISDYGYQYYSFESVKNNRFFRIGINYLFKTGDIFSIRSNSSKAEFGEKRY